VRTSSPLQLVASYSFDVDVDYPRATANIVERLAVTNMGRPVEALALSVLPNVDVGRGREFELRALEIDGRHPPLRWSEDGGVVVVPLARPLRRHGTTDVRIDFTLHPGSGADGTRAAAVSGAGGIIQFLLWYPMLSDGRTIAALGDPLGAVPVSDVRYRITSRTPVDVAVPGVVSGRTRREVSGRLEHARDFAFAIGPRLQRWAGRSGATSVEVYARRGADGATARDIAVRALDRIGRALGTPYPAGRFVLVGGTMDMESSGIAFVHPDAFPSEYRIAHEVAHQWFPWLIGSDQQRAPWLDESLATYLGTGLRPPHVAWCSNAPVDWPADRFPAPTALPASGGCDGYVDTVYLKGAAMLAAIDRAMGHREFTSAVREYVATFRWGVATGDDLLAILRSHAGGHLDRLLRGWLRLPSVPGIQPDRGLGQLP